MAVHFVKLTRTNGKPVYVNADLVTTVCDLLPPNDDTPTVVSVSGDNYCLMVKESPETVVDLLIRAMT